MNARTEELIRMRAFELSQRPDRHNLSAADNWHHAERLVMGLKEDGPAATTVAPSNLRGDRRDLSTPDRRQAGRH